MLLRYVIKHNIPWNSLIFSRNYAVENKWRVLFYGNDQFSLESLKRLHEEYIKKLTISKLEIVTSTSKHNEVIKYAKNHNLTVHQWPSFPSSGEEFHLGIVVSFGYLIPTDIMSKFTLGMLNVHASLLPKLRGAAPIIHSLLNGDTHTGISIMRIKPKRFDIGDVIYQKKIEIPSDMLQPQLFNLLATTGSEALIKCIRELPDCLQNAKIQDNNIATYAPKISRSISKINWNENTALQIYNLSRALNGIYPLVTKFRNVDVKFKRLYLCPEKEATLEIQTNDAAKKPGRFEFIKTKNVIRIWCKDNACVYFNCIQVKGKSEMSAMDFRNGYMKNVPSNELYFEYPS